MGQTAFKIASLERCKNGAHQEAKDSRSANRSQRTRGRQRYIPRGKRCHGFQAVRISDHFIQGVDNLPKFGSVVSILLPTVKH